MAKRQRKNSTSKSTKKRKPNVIKRFWNGLTDSSAGFSRRQYLVENSPYHAYPSFIGHNGKYATILQLYVRPGSNRHLSYREVITFIPTSTLKGVQLHLLEDTALIKDDEKKKLIQKNATMNKAVLEDTEKHEGRKKEDNQSMKNQRYWSAVDYNDYEMIIDSAIPVVVFRWRLVVVGNSRADIDNQISAINTVLAQQHDGAKWDALPGETMGNFTGMFAPIEKTRFNMTSPGNVYSGLNLSVSSGLADPHGVPIGGDNFSLAANTAYFDFEKFTKKQAMIAMPRNSEITQYHSKETIVQPPVPSLAAQYAANQFVCYDHRVHHIVLNDFDYFEKGRYFRPLETEKIFARYDVAQMTINPLQGFGDIKDVVDIHARLINKIVNIFNIMQDFNLNNGDRAAILAVVQAFYFNQGYWRTDADKHPELTRIVGIKHPETYATLVDLLSSFTTLGKRAANQNRELKADRIDTLQALLEQSLSSFTSILGRTTSIEPTNAIQVYYEFDKISSKRIKQIQFINILDYIIYTAKPGDVVIIHGYDQVNKQVADMAYDTIKAAEDHGIRFIFTFDSLSSPTENAGKLNDMFTMQETYYKDLDTDVDWSFIGRALPREMTLVQHALNQDLGPAITDMMQRKTKNQVLVHRHVDQVNNFIGLFMLL